MPNPQIQFPANFTTASAIAYTNADGSVQLVSADNPVPVTVTGGSIGSGGGSGLTDTQLRAAPVPVSLSSFAGVTDLQLRAAPVPVSVSATAGLTDTQLRAAPVAVSLSGFGGLTDVQLRAAPLPVSVSSTAGLTDTQLRATAVSSAPDSVVDAVRTNGTATSAAVLVSTVTTGFNGGSFHVTNAGTTCTITYEQSNDNVNWVALPVISLGAANATPALTTTVAGIYGYATAAAFVRARVSTYTSGTVAVTLAQKRQAPPVVGVSLAGGSSALGSVSITGAISGNTNSGTGYTDSTTALAASATFTGTGRSTASQYAYFHAIAYADQSGTLFVEQSLDSGATYQPILTQAVAAATPAQVALRVTGAYGAATLYRVRYVNGAAAQTTFRLSSAFTR